jgi:hypothetical protein
MIRSNGIGGRIVFHTSGSEKMRITSAGNVGIGTSSPNDKFVVDGGNNIWAGVFRGTSTSSQSFGIQVFGGSNSSDTAFRILNGATTSTYMIVRGDGNVGIGTSSPSELLDVNGISRFRSTIYVADGTATSPSLRFFNANIGLFLVGGSDTIGFSTGNTERMRLTQGGYLKANNTGTYPYSTTNVHEIGSNVSDNTIIINNSSASPSGIFLYYNQAPNGNSNYFYNAYDGNISTKRFAVRSNGGIENYQANDLNLSDERTKKEISLLESYWDKFKAIEIVKFKYKDQTHDDFNIGLIAQQVEEVAPEFIDIDGWDNGKPKIKGQEEIISTEEPMKSIYTADLYHAAIKVLQEAMAKIETLEAQINELKNN